MTAGINILEASIGKLAVHQIVNLTVMYHNKIKSKPLFSKEIQQEYNDLVCDVLKDAISAKLDPEQTLEAVEACSQESLLELLTKIREFYGEEIQQRISAGNDTKYK